MPATAEDAANASQEWLLAQKIRRALQQDIDRVKKCAADGSELELFKKLDEWIAQYRMRCIGTLWLDIEFASKVKVEHSLWTTHIALNAAYRKVKEKYQKPQHAATKHKIERFYDKFLKVTQLFYVGYLQRLCARYRDLSELQRLVRGEVVEKIDVEDKDRIDAVANGIDKQVLASCHLTLIYLGDLWRYRTQLKQPDHRNFDASLAYYRLANDLDPRSGYGHHQMGVILLEQGKHFDIVYHFYRSLAAGQPHPNAAKNLSYEFSKVAESAASPKGKEPHRALQDWIVRLHAHFYSGQEFAQHAELEAEVMHRLSLAVKAHDFVDGLLKLCLINICSYQVAKDKIAAEWTPEASQSCQFTLLFNIRTICVILGQLEPQLDTMVGQIRTSLTQPNSTSHTSGNEAEGKFNALVGDALPLLRVYMTWLCMYRSDIVQFESHLQPYVVQMYKSLSAVLSDLFEIVGHYHRLRVVPYLFQEDLEATGLKALNGSTLPTTCLLGVDSVSGAPKSRPEEAGNQDFKPDDLSFTRALDITTCGVVLADDKAFPLAIDSAPNASHLAKVIYLTEGKTLSPAAAASVPGTSYSSPAAAAAGLSALLGVGTSPKAAAAETAPRPASLAAPNPAGLTNGFTNTLPVHEAFQHTVGPALPAGPPQLTEDSNYAVDHDSRMNELVNGLVEPSESDPSEAVPDRDETSYGMHTATAQDVFHSAVPSISPGLTPNRNELPSLPWSWATAGQPTSHQRDISSGSARSAWPGVSGSPQPVSNRSSTGAAPPYGIAQASNPFAATSNTEYANGYQTVSSESATTTVQGAWQQGRPNNFGNQGPITSAGHSGQSSYASAANASNPWSRGSSKFSSIQDILGAQLGALVPGPRLSASTPVPPNPAVPSSFASTNFSSNTSSLPPVNSPWGVPTRAAGGNGNPGPIGRPTQPGLNTNSRPSSNGNGSGFPTHAMDSSVAYRAPHRRTDSRPDSGPATPGLSGGHVSSNANGPAFGTPDQGSFTAMVQRLQKPQR